MLTDAQVLHDVIVAFERIPGLRSARLYIDVRRRVVTIRGRVHGELERQAAAHAARGIVGLRALVLEVGVTSVPTVHKITETGAAIASSDSGRARDLKHTCPGDHEPHASRDALTGRCETLDSAVNAETQTVSPRRAGVSRQRATAPKVIADSRQGDAPSMG